MKIGTINSSCFERSDQHIEFINSLREGFLPLKFAYIGEAAHTHDELVRSREYGLADTEAKIILEKFPLYIPQDLTNRRINIIDVGGGNGLKATNVIRAFKEYNQDIDYYSLDYSSELLKIATKNLNSLFPSLKTDTFLIDFEERSIKNIVSNINQGDTHPHLFLFLGHTIGNPQDRQKALANISSGMSSGDYLLIGVELYQPTRIPLILEHYKNVPFYRAVFRPLTFCEINEEDGFLDIRFNSITRNVEVFFEFYDDFKIVSNEVNEINFSKGDRLLIFLSHRFTFEEIEALCKEVGLINVEHITDEGQTYDLVFVKYESDIEITSFSI